MANLTLKGASKFSILSSVKYLETIYCRLSLSRTPRDSMKHFEISVLRHIRFAELRKIINQTNTLNRMNM